MTGRPREKFALPPDQESGAPKSGPALFADGGLPAAGQFGEEFQGHVRNGQRKADAVVPEINENDLAFGLNAVNGGSEKNVLAVAQKGADGLFPLAGEVVEQVRGRLRRIGGDLDLALVVRTDGNGGFLLVLMHGDDLVEIEREKFVLVQRHTPTIWAIIGGVSTPCLENLKALR